MLSALEDLIPDGGLAALEALCRPTAALSGRARLRGLNTDPDEVRLARMFTTDRYIFGVKTPFVGRREPLERLYNAVRDAVTERSLNIVHVVGPVGSGKSRLLAETFAIIDPFARGIGVLALTCSPDDEAGDSVLAQLVRRRFGIAVNDRDAVAREKILEGLEPLVDARRLSASARMLGFLAGLRASVEAVDTLPADLAQFQKSAVQELIAVMRSDLAEAPQILVVHQAQHLAADTLELLGGLVRELADAPLVVVLIADGAVEEALRAAAGAAVRVDVGPLDDRDIERQVRAILSQVEGLPDGLVERVVARSGGIPRLAEENVRLLIQQGFLEPGAGRWRISTDRLDAAEPSLATSIDEASRLRVNALSTDERRVLAVASAFGSGFWLDGLVTVLRALQLTGARRDVPWVTDTLRDDIVKALEDLTDEGVVAPDDRPGLDGQREYGFVHERDRDTLYAELPADMRATIHRLVAQWLSGLSLKEPAPWFEVIGEHWDAGGRASTAARFFMRAAEAAGEGYATRRGSDLYRRALALIGFDRAALLVDCLAGLGDLAIRSGDFATARASYGAMLETSLLAGEVRLGAAGWLKLARAHRGLGHYLRARPCLDHAMALYRQINDSRGLAAALDQLAKVVWLEGGQDGYEEALDFAERALELRRRVAGPRAVAESIGTLANIRIQRGELDEAKRLLSEATDLRRQAGDAGGEATCRVGLGAVHFNTGDLEGALALWRDGLELAELVGDRDLVGALLNNIGEALLELGDLAAADTALTEADEVTAATGDQRTAIDVARNRGALACERADFEAAVAFVARAEEVGLAIGARPAVGQVWRTKGDVLSRRAAALGDPGDVEAASRCFDDSVRVFVETGDHIELARTVHVCADHLRRHGDDARADEVLSQLPPLDG